VSLTTLLFFFFRQADVISNNNKPGLNMHAVNLNNNYAPYVVREAKVRTFIYFILFFC